MGNSWLGVSAVVVASIGCSTTFTPQNCEVDTDCDSGLVCELRESEAVCVQAADAPLRIGQSAPVSGTNQALGTEMKLGIELAFGSVNAAGGVRGRQLELVFRDDQYVPELAETAARALVDAQATTEPPRCPSTTTPPVAGQQPVSTTRLDRGPDAVLAILGNVGTPTMVRSAPVAIETGTLFFGAFTGAATLLRDTKGGECAKYIFNVRGSYAQEARATMEYFKSKTVTNYQHLISFDQDDSFGQAGYDGLVQAYKDVVMAFPGGTDPTTPIRRFRYTRNDDASVPAQAAAAQDYIEGLLGGTSNALSIGIMMTDTYGAGTKFIELMRRWQFDGQDAALGKATRLSLYFSNVSFVGPNALAAGLVALGTYSTPQGPRSFADGVVISQVVPNYQSDTSEVVRDYNRLIAEAGVPASFTSLEGYIAGRVFAAGLESHTGPFTPERLVTSFEALPDLSLGLGASAGFSATNHQYSQSVGARSSSPAAPSRTSTSGARGSRSSSTSSKR